MSKMLDPSQEVSEVVTWEDQSNINAFSKLVNRLTIREEELKIKEQDREYLDDLETELELADEDEMLPFRIGDSFIMLPLSRAQARLEKQKEQVSEHVNMLDSELHDIKQEMAELKVKLKTKFGDSINLEN